MKITILNEKINYKWPAMFNSYVKLPEGTWYRWPIFVVHGGPDPLGKWGFNC